MRSKISVRGSIACARGAETPKTVQHAAAADMRRHRKPEKALLTNLITLRKVLILLHNNISRSCRSALVAA
jgi:hypothetical protein